MRKGLDELRTRFWYKKVFKVSKCRNNKKLAESFSGESSNTSSQWASYKNGKKVPTIYLSLVKQKYGVTEEDFKKGPRSLLEIMESGRLRDIYSLFLNEFDRLCHEKGLPTLMERSDALESQKDLSTWFIRLGKRLYDTREEQGFGDDILPFVLAAGHTEVRLFGISRAMTSYILEVLEYFRNVHQIPFEAWAFDADITESVKNAIAFRKMNSLLHSVDSKEAYIEEKYLSEFISSFALNVDANLEEDELASVESS
jgi:hypothetical protein